MSFSLPSLNVAAGIKALYKMEMNQIMPKGRRYVTIIVRTNAYEVMRDKTRATRRRVCVRNGQLYQSVNSIFLTVSFWSMEVHLLQIPHKPFIVKSYATFTKLYFCLVSFVCILKSKYLHKICALFSVKSKIIDLMQYQMLRLLILYADFSYSYYHASFRV